MKLSVINVYVHPKHDKMKSIQRVGTPESEILNQGLSRRRNYWMTLFGPKLRYIIDNKMKNYRRSTRGTGQNFRFS